MTKLQEQILSFLHQSHALRDKYYPDSYRQLIANPKTEIVAAKPDGHWMRYTGKAVFETDPKYAEARWLTPDAFDEVEWLPADLELLEELV